MEANNIPKIDDVAARREARRRKILENSKNRLCRITGRENTEEDDEKSAVETEEQTQQRIIYPDPEIERDVYIPQSLPIQSEIFRNGEGMSGFEDQTQFFELFNSLQQQQSSGNSSGNMNSFAAFAQFGNFDGSTGSNPLFGNMNNHENAKVPENRVQKFLRSKMHVGILAIFTYLLISLAPFRWNVFLIFLTWEMAEIFILRQYESNPNGLINVLFMLAGVSPAKVNVFIKWIQLLNKVLRDVALFMFVFVIAHVCRMYGTGMNQILVTDINDQIVRQIVMDENSNDVVFENFEL